MIGRRREHLVLLAVPCIAALLGLGLLADRAADAASARNAALDRHQETLNKCSELAELRAASARVDEAPRPEPDLIAAVERALREAGVRGAIDQVTLSEAERVRDTPYRRQRVSLRLSELAPADLVRFLEQWRVAEPRWTVQSIRLDHRPVDRRRQTSWDPHGAYAVQLTLENVFVEGPR